MKTSVQKNLFGVMINDVENLASLQRKSVASGFLPPHVAQSSSVGTVLNNASQHFSGGSSDAAARTVVSPSISTVTTALAAAGDANKFYLLNRPSKINVNGWSITLDQRMTKFANNIIELPAAPESSTRQDLVILEVWKERVNLGSPTDVLFPFGNVFYDPYDQETTYDTCTLLTADQTGGNYPLYLDVAAGGFGPEGSGKSHGSYVSANDANVVAFISNPENNIGVGSDGIYFQIRWRISSIAGVDQAFCAKSTDGTWRLTGVDVHVRPQGQKATRPTAGTAISALGVFFNQSSTNKSRSNISDSGLYLGGSYVNTSTFLSAISGVSLDGFVYGIPIAIVHRRNTTAWSLANPNGAGAIGASSGRPDGKFYNHIHSDDVLDLRHRVAHSFNMEELYEESLQKVLSSNMTSNWDNLVSGTSPYGPFTDLGIYGTKLLRAEGIASDPFDASFKLCRIAACNNGITAHPDGLRNYFSDIEGEQAVLGRIPDISANTVLPTPMYTYAAASKELVCDATALSSYDGESDFTPIFSGRAPDLYWSDAGNIAAFAGKGVKVDYSYDTLVGEQLTLTIKPTTEIIINVDIDVEVGVAQLAEGDIYESPNGVQVTFDGMCVESFFQGALYISGHFSSSTIPIQGSGMWSKISSTGGPMTLYVLGVADLGYKYSEYNTTDVDVPKVYMGEGANLHAGKAVFINTYLKFNAGSGFLSRVPYCDPSDASRGQSSIKGCHHYIDGTQSLPNNGIGFKPFGTNVSMASRGISSDPDNSFSVDSHSKSTGLVGFVNTGVTGLSTISGAVCVLKDGNTYHAWYTHDDNSIRHAISSDGIAWTGDAEVLAVGTWADDLVVSSIEMSGGSVIKDGATFKMWISGLTSSRYDIFYATSNDGITWSNPTRVITHGDGGALDTNGSIAPSVIKDGSYYRMWYSGNGAAYRRIVYAESENGTWWVEYANAVSNSIFEEIDKYRCNIIKEDSVYKMFLEVGMEDLSRRTMYSVSMDGKNWSFPIFLASRITGDEADTYISSVIKIDKKYRFWGKDNSRAAIMGQFTAVDSNNVGSSTIGVYASEGSMNFAPRSTDSVVIFYETRALQQDWTKLDVSNRLKSANIKYLPKSGVVTTLGTGGYLVKEKYPLAYRDFTSTLLLGGDNTWLCNGSQFYTGQEINNLKFDTISKYSSIKTDVIYEFTGLTTSPKVGDSIDQVLEIDDYELSGYKVSVAMIPFTSSLGSYIIMSGNSADWIQEFVGGVMEKNKELFMAATINLAMGADTRIAYSIILDLVGRPITK